MLLGSAQVLRAIRGLNPDLCKQRELYVSLSSFGSNPGTATRDWFAGCQRCSISLISHPMTDFNTDPQSHSLSMGGEVHNVHCGRLMNGSIDLSVRQSQV